MPYTTRPVSLTYTGQKQSPGQLFDYNIGVAHNIALGSKYTNVDGTTDRYSYLTPGNRSTRDDFNIVRLGGSYFTAFRSDWQVRVAVNGQYSGNPLVSVEQLGLAGSTAVRGFNERAVTADSGYVVNTELYTPELANATGAHGSLRALVFYDFARGYNQNVPSASLTPTNVDLASAGAGLRYGIGKDFSLRFDLAQVSRRVPYGTKNRGDWRGHLNVMLAI